MASVIPASVRDRLLDRWEPIAPAVRRGLPPRRTLKSDGVSGLTSAIGSVPDGMAAGVLAGVNPVYGLYASLVGPIAGGALSSTHLMVVTTTSAAALGAGEALSGLSGDDRAQGLFLLVLIMGIAQIVAGILRLGRLVRFVSHSVMTGFLTGVSVLIVLGQLGDITGTSPEGGNRISQTIYLLRHLGGIDLRTLVIGGLAILLAATLVRTRIGAFGALIALAAPSVLVILFNWDNVAIVNDIGGIPRGLPVPELPQLSLASVDLITGALAIAAIVLIQGAGVSQGVPNPDGSPSSVSRDFIAAGAANVASGLFRGMPVGGSVGQTALGVSAGARTRWAAIFSGIWMAVILVIFPGLIEQVALTALAGLLILAGISSVNLGEALSIWRTNWIARVAMCTTFLATLLTPIQVAVGIGVVLSAVLYLYRISSDTRVVEIVALPNGLLEERDPPEQLPHGQVTILHVYGSLFYAGARTFQESLPAVQGATNPVVVLRLRGKMAVGSTLVNILANYADELHAAGGKLYLSGVDERVQRSFTRSGKLGFRQSVEIYPATPVLGASSRQAVEDATVWLVNQVAQPPTEQGAQRHVSG